MSPIDKVYALMNQRIFIPPAGVVAVEVSAGQQEIIIKKIAGGSLAIGGTYSLVNGVTTAFSGANGYLMGDSEVLSINSAGSFLLGATGSTVTALVLKGLSEGF